MPPKISDSSSSRPSTSRTLRSRQTQQIPNLPQTPPRQPQASNPAPRPQSTPLVKKTSQDLPCTSGHVYRNLRMTAMAEEAEDHILGPMPLETFLETFFKKPKGRQKEFVSKARRNIFKKKIKEMALCTVEKDLYPVFIKAVEDLCPNFPPYDTHDKVFKDFHNITVKPDVCFYDKKWAKQERRGISTVELMAEFKISLNDDAFIDSKGFEPSSYKYAKPAARDDDKMNITIHEPMLREAEEYAHDDDDDDEEDEDDGNEEDEDEGQDEDSEEANPFEADITKLTLQGRDTLGQITSYATAQKSAQFRTHIFSMLVFQQHARLLYWDNAGVVVTERFHLTNGLFAEFLGRYNKASAEERGYDSTARLLHKNELNVVRRARVFAKDARLVMLTTTTSRSDSLYVAEQLTYMGGTSPFGRSTRGFIAYSYSELTTLKGQAKKVFLKDTWRVIDRPREHTFYATLHEKKVPYIPNVLRSLDIQDQETIMQKLCEEDPSWARKAPQGLRGFQHYRLILKEVGTPLTEFSSTKELVTIVYQALQAHALAYTEAKILHRDISVGNIMICEADGEGNRTALLVDWDMAKSQDDQSPSAKERTGTWQFAAARLLADSSQSLPHVLQDDLESFVHVLTWVAFRYTEVAFKPETLYRHMHNIFDANYRVGCRRVGGTSKKEYLDSNIVLSEANIRAVNPALHYLLLETKKAVAVRYIDVSNESEGLFFTRKEESMTEHKEKLEFIKTSKGMINIFHAYLERKPWPKDDAAHENEMQKPIEVELMKGSSELVKHIAVKPATRKRKMSAIL